MNRIILVGNGFDLAHGLETSYRQFIDWFWKEKIQEMLSNNLLKTDCFTIVNNPISASKIRHMIAVENVKTFQQLEDLLSNIRDRYHCENFEIVFDNEFLLQISCNRNLKKWVDIEEE